MMFSKIEVLLAENSARYRVIEHVAAGKSAEIAAIRGNDPRRSAKALVIDGKMKTGGIQHYLVILPANCQLNSKNICKAIAAKSISMNPDVEALTGCIPGTVPPFSFQDNLKVLLDQKIAALDSGEIFFNAGDLTRSIALDVTDYLRITASESGDFSKEPTPTPVAASSIFAAVAAESHEGVSKDVETPNATI
jgi:Ala-tRNA(Pro) deacylase